jgi:hypothetical protein
MYSKFLCILPIITTNPQRGITVVVGIGNDCITARARYLSLIPSEDAVFGLVTR